MQSGYRPQPRSSKSWLGWRVCLHYGSLTAVGCRLHHLPHELLQRLLEHLHATAAGFPQSEQVERGPGRRHLPLTTQSWKSHSITSTLFCWSYWPETIQGVRGLCTGKGNWGPPWRLPTTGQSDFSLWVFSVFCCCYWVFPLGR